MKWRNNPSVTLKACYMGFITQAVNVNLAPLLFLIFQNEFGVSYAQLGQLILINFGTQVGVDFLTTRYVDRIGYRPAIVASGLLSVLGLCGLSILPQVMENTYAALCISVVLCSFGSGLIEVLCNPIVDSLPGGQAKERALTLLHSFYCWGQMAVVLVTTLLLKLFGSDFWRWIPLLWALVPLAELYLFVVCPIYPVAQGEKTMSIHSLFCSRLFVLELLLMICAGSSELAMSQWSSLFAEKGLGVSKVLGDLLGPCLFAAFMGIGRTMYGRFSDRLKLHKALLLSGLLCVACYLLVVFSAQPIVSLLACAVCGLSVALMWPGTVALSGKTFPTGGTAMFGLLALAGDVGGAVGPWMTGVVSDLAQGMTWAQKISQSSGLSLDQVGLKAGLLLGMIFPMVMVAVLMLLWRTVERRTNPQ